MKSGIEKAVDIVGGQSALAKYLKITNMAVCKWVKDGLVPAARVLDVEKITGISRTELNPNIYPPEDQAA